MPLDYLLGPHKSLVANRMMQRNTHTLPLVRSIVDMVFWYQYYLEQCQADNRRSISTSLTATMYMYMYMDYTNVLRFTFLYSTMYTEHVTHQP